MDLVSNNGLSLDVEPAIILYSAHEATHLAQIFRGENPASFFEENNYDANNPYEKEAWEEGIKTLKMFYPTASGFIDVEDTRYEI
ncbi:MAG: hypothetical protein KDJ75_08800 [Alphaproteobacteria bacterium]|nr:hypothetical protein [Alphaproteobacteria bacterium]